MFQFIEETDAYYCILDMKITDSDKKFVLHCLQELLNILKPKLYIKLHFVSRNMFYLNKHLLYPQFNRVFPKYNTR